MHKERAKASCKAAGVPVAEARLVTRARGGGDRTPWRRPTSSSRSAEGSSVGVVIVGHSAASPPAAIASGGARRRDRHGGALRRRARADLRRHRRLRHRRHRDRAQPGLAFYDFEAKYAPGGSKHELPARILPDVYELLRKYTLAAHRALGCRGVSRADFRFDDTPGGSGDLICLEVNTQPGMTGTSLVPELAQYAGWSFGELVRWIVEDASCE